jgi:hypothetical protein
MNGLALAVPAKPAVTSNAATLTRASGTNRDERSSECVWEESTLENILPFTAPAIDVRPATVLSNHLLRCAESTNYRQR